MRKGESGTNNLLEQQISANLQRLLVWHSGDYDGLQSQRSEVQGECKEKKKKNWGVDLRLGLGLGGSMGLGLGMGLDVWLGGGAIGLGMGLDIGLVVCVLFFLRSTPSPSKSGKLPS